MRSTNRRHASPSVPVRNAPSRRRVPQGESPRERFKRISSIRLANAERAVNLLEHLGSSSTYDMRPTEAAQIVERLRRATERVETALKGDGPRAPTLKFDD